MQNLANLGIIRTSEETFWATPSQFADLVKNSRPLARNLRAYRHNEVATNRLSTPQNPSQEAQGALYDRGYTSLNNHPAYRTLRTKPRIQTAPRRNIPLLPPHLSTMRPTLRCLVTKKVVRTPNLPKPTNKMQQMISVLADDPRFARPKSRTVTNVTSPEVIGLSSAQLYPYTLTVRP